MTLRKGENRPGTALAPVQPVRGRLLKARGAAEYLGITESRVRTLIASGELASVRRTNGRLEGVYERDCDAWVAARLRGALPSPARPSIDERIQHLPGVRHFA